MQEDKHWVGGPGNWSDGAKWDPIGVPTRLSDVFIAQEGSFVNVDIDPGELRSLRIGSDDVVAATMSYNFV